jgi:hypothetical protein
MGGTVVRRRRRSTPDNCRHGTGVVGSSYMSTDTEPTGLTHWDEYPASAYEDLEIADETGFDDGVDAPANERRST